MTNVKTIQEFRRKLANRTNEERKKSFEKFVDSLQTVEIDAEKMHRELDKLRGRA